MRDGTRNRAALVGGVSLLALMIGGPTGASAAPGDGFDFWFGGRSQSDEPPAVTRRAVKNRKSLDKDTAKRKAKAPDTVVEPKAEIVVPPGPLHVIVSIDKQRVTLFANGTPVTQSKISSGTDGHPTPLGVFSVIQKRQHHISNLYGAAMPYMQRLTWSGTAMHAGPLPGYPASHGCIRLTDDFARLLWKATKIGARVIIARGETTPVEIEHQHLFTPRPRTAGAAVPLPPVRDANAGLVRTAEATGMTRRDATGALAGMAQLPPGPEQPTKLLSVGEERPESPRVIAESAPVQAASPVVAAPQAVPTASAAKPSQPEPSITERLAVPSIIKLPAGERANRIRESEPRVTSPPPAPVSRVASEQAERKPGSPISIFISRREGRLYVRQGMDPLFEARVAIERPEQPLGTHVYTAMDWTPSGTGLRWTVVSIPSSYPKAAEPAKKSDTTKKPRSDKAVKPAAAEPEPVPGARHALDRLALPQELRDRIESLVAPGSSLIVSDNKLSDETGSHTGFIVVTR